MPTTKTRRTKCFTGCWTCRARRVKCDEATPSCKRCRDFGIQCEGYGIRLNWVQCDGMSHDEDEDDDGSRMPKRLINGYLGQSRVPRLTSPEIDATLAQLDEWSPGESVELQKCGFSVFTANLSGYVVLDPPPQALTPVAPPTPLSHHQDTSATETADETDRFYTEQSEDNTEPNHYYPDNATIPVAQTLSTLGLACDNIHQQQQSSSLVVAAGPAPLHNQQSPSTIIDTVPAPPLQHQVPSPSRHIDIFTSPTTQKRLIHHWVTFTSRKIALLDEPHNPCRTMMLPMALQGLTISSSESNANVAIFHALCASAAWNLFELGGRTNEKDRGLALTHDQQAIHHLRHNLERADEHQDQSFAMAIMACIAVEAISGTTQRWRTHVSGGLAYLAKLQSRGIAKAVLSPFQRHMVSMAILCEVAVRDVLNPFLNDRDNGPDEDKGLEFTFPYYGISRSFLRALDRMNTFAKTSISEKDLDAFELQLYLDFPSIPLQTPSSLTNAQIDALHHTSKTFYYAALVFFQRSIRRATVLSVQSLVELGVRELEAISQIGKKVDLGCMMLWPVLVLGAECGDDDVKKRMRGWLKEQRKLGFRNLVVLEELVEAVWRERGREGEKGGDVDWRNVIVRDGFDVFRL
ncbi:hypothetical protein GQ43DRAFT_479790 [Delitschia confertaspora ATCC 74209]|uniref:Zn(2)-C6 fungal-type domain-containing protein n=1 Tax=Delitschia confertaspora ATCC 74209 TaxID=1513339 RepID=A0A9P4JSS9_9PLEO|nr:hypothetical protein GQ43DRAFT_479790 [Delitschia confertaspora ATCC 74209]